VDAFSIRTARANGPINFRFSIVMLPSPRAVLDLALGILLLAAVSQCMGQQPSPTAAGPPPAGNAAAGNATSSQDAGVAAPNQQNKKTPDAGNNASEQPKSQTDKGKSSDILSWLFEDEKAKLYGLTKPQYAALLLLLGAIGGMITAFYSVGEALPGIGGSGLIEPEIARMRAFEDAVEVCGKNLADIQGNSRTVMKQKMRTSSVSIILSTWPPNMSNR